MVEQWFKIVLHGVSKYVIDFDKSEECKGVRIGLIMDSLQSVRVASCWAGLDYGKLAES